MSFKKVSSFYDLSKSKLAPPLIRCRSVATMMAFVSRIYYPMMITDKVLISFLKTRI